ncbi:uncharacterized protein LOC129921407 [Episyrphus balteatus]|uniref:uncharacterized protein LOC129921407 n=1 Tax=Episyrphus balteatus TaxID=286459 RepID=UPI002485DCB1|nr:uncharacterized protein LOC129921407 [Episyrphus balteatus]
MSKAKAKGYESSSSERECEQNEQKKRGKRFSQLETDLLLSLLMSDNVPNMESSKVTLKGRSMGWETITKSFNASPNVVQRTEKELRDRSSNIRKDLYRLARFEKSMLAATDDDVPRKPSVSFEFSNVVKRYAFALNVDLAGLANYKEEDYIPMPVYDPLENNQSSNSFDNEMKPRIEAVVSFDDELTSTLKTPYSSSLRPATQSHNTRYTNGNQQLNRHNIVYSPSKDLLRKKARLLADENKRRNEDNERRNEWHIRCMDIKNEELAIKKKQSEFWSIMIDKLKQTPTSITDIANVVRTIDASNPISFDINHSSESLFTNEQCGLIDNLITNGETDFDNTKEKEFSFIKEEHCRDFK